MWACVISNLSWPAKALADRWPLTSAYLSHYGQQDSIQSNWIQFHLLVQGVREVLPSFRSASSDPRNSQSRRVHLYRPSIQIEIKLKSIKNSSQFKLPWDRQFRVGHFHRVHRQDQAVRTAQVDRRHRLVPVLPVVRAVRRCREDPSGPVDQGGRGDHLRQILPTHFYIIT